MKNELFKKLNKWSTAAKDKVNGLKLITEGFEIDLSAVNMPIERLASHTRFPEVRILIFGPLKSGKSTLMNVLARNFRVSQVDPRPAFPCVIEVRGAADGNETSEFFKKDGESPYLKCSIDESRTKLDALLQEYISGFPSERPVKIVQHINFNEGFRNGGILDDGISMVLVDSPGLLFDDKEYTEETDRQRGEADVAVLLLRPEQLFFREINEIIRKALDGGSGGRGNAYQRIFVIVNASEKATQINSDGKFEDYNQIEKKKEILDYFTRHVAEDDIAGKLTKGGEISIDFIDLLVASRSLAEKNIESFLNLNQGIALRTLEEYLRGNLVNEKLRKLNGDWLEIIKSGNDIASNLKGLISDKAVNIENSIGNEQRILEERKLAFQKEERRENEKKSEIEKLKAWKPDNILENWPADMENALRKWTQTHGFERQNMEDDVQRIVRKWLIPGNTLNGLHAKIFDDTVQSGVPSLLRRYEEINLHAFDEAKKICADMVRKGNEDLSITESLVSALEEVRPERISIPGKGDSHPLFDLAGIVSKKWTILIKTITLGLGGNHYWSNEEFWGNKGNQPLDRHRIESLGERYQDSWWASRILDEPWALWEKVFSPDAISRQCIAAFMKPYAVAAKDKIRDKAVKLKCELEEISKEKILAENTIIESQGKIEGMNKELIKTQTILRNLNRWGDDWRALEHGATCADPDVTL
jgi:hypothetical protein